MAENDYNIMIGEITTTFGRRGEVKVKPDTDFPEHFDVLEEVFVSGGRIAPELYKIEGVRHHKGAVMVKFKGIDDLNAAEEFRGAKVYINEELLVPLGEDEYFIHDIVGLEVVTTEGESMGPVKEVLRSPANDVYVTEIAMIPAVKEFVVSIDLEAGKIVVRPIEGMIQK